MLIRNVYADMIFNDNSMGELKGLIYLKNNSAPSLPRAVMVKSLKKNAFNIYKY